MDLVLGVNGGEHLGLGCFLGLLFSLFTFLLLVLSIGGL